jgi:DNA/RNA-binding domain of Phe-tRNA-synthetase-like protein
MTMFVVSEGWRAAHPGASVGILVMRGLENPKTSPALEERRLAVEAALRERFRGMDRQEMAATAPLDAYRAYFKRFKKTNMVQLQLESVVSKEKHIPSFSSLVTAMFTAELKNQIITAGHDLDALRPPVTLRSAVGGETFTIMGGNEQSVKAGDMFMEDTAGIISVVVYGPDQRTRITPATSAALYTAYAPPGVDPAAVRGHMEDLRDNLLLVAPGAQVERLEVYWA